MLNEVSLGQEVENTMSISLLSFESCAHFIEHVEGIVDGSVYAKNREHGRVLVNWRGGWMRC
jgi:hypothetical protein